MQILIVDDNYVSRKQLETQLSVYGDCLAVADANAALEMFKLAHENSAPYDVILMDWYMPDKSGLEALREIRAKDTKVHVIMVTSEAKKDRVIEAIQAGASDYVIKPFTAATINKKLQRVLQGGVA